jgi:hypothetical protein
MFNTVLTSSSFPAAISILPALLKAMEIVMRDPMFVFVDNFSFLDCLQSDFNQFSCGRKLMTVLLLLDFSKAFDNGVHSLLCSKLSSLFRFHETAVELIRSYLNDRYQCVCLDGKISDLVLVARAQSLGLFCSPYLSMILILHQELPNAPVLFVCG